MTDAATGGNQSATTAQTSTATTTDANKTAATTQQTTTTDANKNATLAQGGDVNTGAPTTFPEDWRKQLGGEDAKELARLERFDSPKSVYKSFRELEGKLNSGQLKSVTPLPANATAEQLTEYRKANGIPETYDKYDTTLSNGLTISELDKPIANMYLKAAHDNNMPPAMVKANLEWFFKMNQDIAAQREADNAKFKTDSAVALKGEWGGEYQQNKNIIDNFVATMPKDTMDRLLNGYTQDGKRAGDDPEINKLLWHLATQINPMATVVPNSTNPGQTIVNELQNLQKMMGNKSSEYWKGPKAVENQARYRELLEAQEKTKSRAA